jgi:hypothetical protein
MFRRTSPQRPLFGVEHRLDSVKRARMEKTWAHAYQTKALGLIDESRFALRPIAAGGPRDDATSFGGWTPCPRPSDLPCRGFLRRRITLMLT